MEFIEFIEVIAPFGRLEVIAITLFADVFCHHSFC